MKKAACFLVILFAALMAGAQTNYGTEATIFLQRYNNTVIRNLSATILDSAIQSVTTLIENEEAIPKPDLARLYVARAKLQAEKLGREQSDLNSGLHASSELFERVERDYNKACELSEECACEHLQDLHDFFTLYDSETKAKEVDERMTKMGINDELHTFLGLGVNYIAPKNILGVEAVILGVDPVRQKKTIDPSTGRAYRPCGYQYPMAVGLLAIGYEASLNEAMDPSKYNGVKLDPVWVNYYVSLRPAQFLFCNSSAGNSFVWRPEIGYAFSSFSISYAYNLAFRKSFTYLSPHNLSIHFIIPTLHMEKD